MSLLLLFGGEGTPAPPGGAAKVSRITIGIGIRIGGAILSLLGLSWKS
jgi:hypothetical protein